MVASPSPAPVSTTRGTTLPVQINHAATMKIGKPRSSPTSDPIPPASEMLKQPRVRLSKVDALLDRSLFTVESHPHPDWTLVIIFFCVCRCAREPAGLREPTLNRL